MSEYREPSAELRARVAMEKYRFQTTHSLGQNFILDDRFIDHLLDAAGVCASDNVLEIGPGAGVMTSRLAQRARQVLAIEVDKGLEPVLSEVLNGEENVQLVFQDVMKADIDSMVNAAFGGASYRVVANLPYYITADVLLKLVRGERLPESISIMVQKEADTESCLRRDKNSGARWPQPCNFTASRRCLWKCSQISFIRVPM